MTRYIIFSRHWSTIPSSSNGIFSTDVIKESCFPEQSHSSCRNNLSRYTEAIQSVEMQGYFTVLVWMTYRFYLKHLLPGTISPYFTIHDALGEFNAIRVQVLSRELNVGSNACVYALCKRKSGFRTYLH